MNWVGDCLVNKNIRGGYCLENFEIGAGLSVCSVYFWRELLGT